MTARQPTSAHRPPSSAARAMFVAMIVRPKRARRRRHQPRLDHQRPDRTEPEHHQRVAEGPVRQSLGPTARPTPRPSASRRPRGRGGRDHRLRRDAPHARDARCETANRRAARKRYPASGSHASTAERSRARSRERRRTSAPKTRPPGPPRPPRAGPRHPPPHSTLLDDGSLRCYVGLRYKGRKWRCPHSRSPCQTSPIGSSAHF